MDFKGLAAELLRMQSFDQYVRSRSLKEPDYWIEGLDEKHTARLQEIVDFVGWPTASKVGKEAADAAWLIAQHADHDVRFQRSCLAKMKATAYGEVEPRHVAMLEDRVRVNEGRLQVYGTQFTQRFGKHVPRPMENPRHVDERRAKMGLAPLEEGIRGMYEKYGAPNVPWWYSILFFWRSL